MRNKLKIILLAGFLLALTVGCNLLAEENNNEVLSTADESTVIQEENNALVSSTSNAGETKETNEATSNNQVAAGVETDTKTASSAAENNSLPSEASNQTASELEKTATATNTVTTTNQGDTEGNNAEKSNAVESLVSSDMATANSSTTQIILNGLEANITGAGAKLASNTVTITQGGTYRLSGNFNGGIVITTPKTDKVQLILDGVHITATQNAAIYCKQADLLTITLAPGSTNIVTDATKFTYADTTAKEPDATIFSKTDLTIGGTGSLQVTANFNNGIGTKDDLVITGGVLNITAANHGIRGRDSLTILDGNFTINSTADALQSNNDEDVNKGWISLEGGSYQITAGNDAIQAETTLSISGGTYKLTSGGGSTATTADSTSSFKGLKASTNMVISGGNFTINSLDDTVHANGNITISGGIFRLSTGDDGVHADGDLTISGKNTKIDIITAYEGLEAKTMTIADGIMNINSTDDGINIAGGNDTATAGPFGRDNFSSNNSEQWLLISGGTITVIAGSDAIDINGSGQMTGGTVDLTAATLGEGQTLDVDNLWEQTGGDLTETGGNGPGGPGGGGRGGDFGERPGFNPGVR